jgi:hypothetical protein
VTDANGERAVRVVLGEADPSSSIVQFVLEGEGFAIIGRAANDVDLGRVLAGARPDVIVLGDGISAAAAQRARDAVASASLVVVWPRDVVALVADERVLPDDVVDELGGAVRRAAVHVRHADEELAVPAPSTVARDLVALVPDAGGTTRHRHRRRVLAAAAMMIVYAAALSTVAAAVTGVWDVGGIRGGRPSPAGSVGPPVLSADGASASASDVPDDDVAGGTSGDRDGAAERPVRRVPGARGASAPAPPEAPGREDNPGRGHGSEDNPGRGHGSEDNPGRGHGAEDNPGRGHGRDDRPGSGSGSDHDPGRGDANGGGRSDETRPGDDGGERDRSDRNGGERERRARRG